MQYVDNATQKSDYSNGQITTLIAINVDQKEKPDNDCSQECVCNCWQRLRMVKGPIKKLS